MPANAGIFLPVLPMDTQSTSLHVGEREAGTKLLRFLERHLHDDYSPTMLHKWIRTGQVRVNGKRAKPFLLLDAGDLVRLPPFAHPRQSDTQRDAIVQPASLAAPLRVDLGEDMPVVASFPEYFIVHKPAGLAVQGGAHHADNVAARCQNFFSGCSPIPAPVHRLDRATSGLLVIGSSQRALRALSEAFSRPGGVIKEYVAVVEGTWPYATPVLLADTLVKQQRADGQERMVTQGQGIVTERVAQTPVSSPAAYNAHCIVACLGSVDGQEHGLAGVLSVLQIRLLTGKKHQIRVQLAARGHAIVGDTLHGGMPAQRLFLHAFRVVLPGEDEVVLLPAWPKDFTRVAQEWKLL